MKKTKANYEEYLNQFYKGQSYSTVVSQHLYLTNENRGEHISERALKSNVVAGKIGSLVRRLDPIAFNVGYNDWTA